MKSIKNKAMLEEDYDYDYLREIAILEEENRMRMEAEFLEAEYYAQQPAKITVIKTLKEHENTTNG